MRKEVERQHAMLPLHLREVAKPSLYWSVLNVFSVIVWVCFRLVHRHHYSISRQSLRKVVDGFLNTT